MLISMFLANQTDMRQLLLTWENMHVLLLGSRDTWIYYKYNATLSFEDLNLYSLLDLDAENTVIDLLSLVLKLVRWPTCLLVTMKWMETCYSVRFCYVYFGHAMRQWTDHDENWQSMRPCATTNGNAYCIVWDSFTWTKPRPIISRFRVRGQRCG